MRLVNVLIVENNKPTADLMMMLIKLLGYNVTNTVVTGEEAIILAKGKGIDLVLMDIKLDGQINGIEAAKGIREFSNIPIIFEKVLLVCVFIIFLLLHICMITPIITGEVIPYKTAVYSNACIGLMPKKLMASPSDNAIKITM